MILIVGLGNPTEQHSKTRHNIGWMVLDALLTSVKNSMHENMQWKRDKRCHGFIAKNEDMVLLKPKTFMNESGKSVATCARILKVAPKNIWVVHDDSDLSLGNIRIAFDHSSAGHKGVQSIVDQVHTQKIFRIKIGIRPNASKQKSEQFVLKPFSKKEKELLNETIQKTVDALDFALVHGPAAAMSIYNRKESEQAIPKKKIQDPF